MGPAAVNGSVHTARKQHFAFEFARVQCGLGLRDMYQTVNLTEDRGLFVCEVPKRSKLSFVRAFDN